MTFASTNVATTTLSSGQPSVNVNLGILNPSTTLDPLSLNSLTTLVVNVNLSGTGVTFNLAQVNLVGTYNVQLQSFTFASQNISFITQAGDCGTFSFTINPLSITTVLQGGALTGSLSNVACGTCPPPTPTPEPATMLLLGTGLVGVTGTIWKWRRAKKERDTDEKNV